MIKTLFGAATLAIAIAATPASAQLLGGGAVGGLGGSIGGMGGPIGGSLGGAGSGMLGGTIERGPINTDSASRASSSTHTSRKVDTRKGIVSASGTSTTDSAFDASSRIGKRSLATGDGGTLSTGGSADVQLIGTDAARGVAGRAVDTTRGMAGGAATTARGAADRGRGAAGSATSRATGLVRNSGGSAGAVGSGSLSGNAGNGSAMGGLALAGSGAADAGGFPVMPGMAVTDAKGRAIGVVQSVRSTSRGAVDQVLVRVGKRTAALPASNFSGSGNLLVSAMGKGDVKAAAK